MVSDTGLVKSLPRYRCKGGILKPNTYAGYCRVRLGKNSKLLSIHRLVAEAFIPNPENKPHINHKNGIKSDNHVKNLEWCTAKENCQHSINVLNNKRIGESNGNSKVNETIVKEIRNTYATGNYTYKQLALKYNLTISGITMIVTKRSWKNV